MAGFPKVGLIAFGNGGPPNGGGSENEKLLGGVKDIDGWVANAGWAEVGGC